MPQPSANRSLHCSCPYSTLEIDVVAQQASASAQVAAQWRTPSTRVGPWWDAPAGCLQWAIIKSLHNNRWTNIRNCSVVLLSLSRVVRISNHRACRLWFCFTPTEVSMSFWLPLIILWLLWLLCLFCIAYVYQRESSLSILEGISFTIYYSIKLGDKYKNLRQSTMATTNTPPFLFWLQTGLSSLQLATDHGINKITVAYTLQKLDLNAHSFWPVPGISY